MSFRNKLWITNGTLITIKRMSTSHIVNSLRNFKEFDGNGRISDYATREDLKNELKIRNQMVDQLLKRVPGLYEFCKEQENKPCGMLGSSKPKSFSTNLVKLT